MSFFLIGEQAERYPEIVSWIVREGHAIGNHSWSHPRFERLPLAAQREEIERTDRLLTAIKGRERHDFRPPRGVLPPRLLLDCVRSGRRIAYWSYDSLDYSPMPAEALIASAKRHPVVPGDILLLHDDNARSLRLLEAMLPVWTDQGFSFDSLPETDQE